MKYIRLESGHLAPTLNKQEQDEIWRELSQVMYNSKTPFYTPHDNLRYYFLSETEIDSCKSPRKYKTVISANGKQKSINLEAGDDAKINKLVRSMY